MEDENPKSVEEKFTWKIDNFCRLEEYQLLESQTFTLGGCDWRMEFRMFPACIGIYFVAQNYESSGWWTRDVTLSLVLVDQHSRSNSVIRGEHYQFNLGSTIYKDSFPPLAEILGGTKGFVVEDSMILEVSLTVHSITLFEPVSDNLEVAAAEACETPSMEEIEHAKQALEECLSSPFFHPGMKDKLSGALSALTFSADRAGLSPDQYSLLVEFHWNLDYHIRSCETFEKTSSAFVSAKLDEEEAIAATKEELSRTMEKVNAKKRKLIPELDACITQTEKAKRMCEIHESKVKRARAAKMKAEDKKEESIIAWLKLKKVFS